jgi:hypothetical protein
MQGEARLRGLWRIIYSKTITNVVQGRAAIVGWGVLYVPNPFIHNQKKGDHTHESAVRNNRTDRSTR